MKEDRGRFAIAAADGRRSSIWNWRVARNDDNVYLSAKPTANVVKVSLHCADHSQDRQQFQVSITQEFLNLKFKKTGEKNVPLPDGSRHFEKTAAFHEIAPGVRRVFALIFPTGGLSDHSNCGEAGADIYMIEPSDERNSTRVEVIVTVPGVIIPDWPGKRDPGTKLIAHRQLPSGANVWIVHYAFTLVDFKIPARKMGANQLMVVNSSDPVTLEALRSMNLKYFVPGFDDLGILTVVEGRVAMPVAERL